MASEARRDDDAILPMQDPEWEPKTGEVETPVYGGVPKAKWVNPKRKWKDGWPEWLKAGVFMLTIFLFGIGWGFITKEGCTDEAKHRSYDETVDKPDPPFGRFSGTKLELGADGASGYLLSEGRLFHLTGQQAVEVLPNAATRPSSR